MSDFNCLYTYVGLEAVEVRRNGRQHAKRRHKNAGQEVVGRLQ